MIPPNISREHVLKALRKIEEEGIPPGRSSKKFNLIHNGKPFPPKYVISLANLFANGKKLNSEVFSGGQETNNYLMRLGFEIEGVKKDIIRKKVHIRAKHSERCPECKKTVNDILRKLYGDVATNYRFDFGTRPEDFKYSSHYPVLRKIFERLQEYRNHKDFVRSEVLPHCDFFMKSAGFILEFDESQHFSIPRKISLDLYPEDMKLGFSRQKWTRLCEEIKAQDNDPAFRDEQRAWYDVLRDFLPMIKGLKPTVRIYSKEMAWCELKPDNPEDFERFRNLIGRNVINRGLVATVIMESSRKSSDEARKALLSRILEELAKRIDENCVILFPGGYFSAGKEEARTIYDLVGTFVKDELAKAGKNFVVCIGIDGRVEDFSRDQIAMAISRRGIEAIGRKFHPAPVESGRVELAKDFRSTEEGLRRTFSFGGRTYFLGACYDSFGIKHLLLPNPGVDVVLDLVHGFTGSGKGSGCSYFARHGFAGTSKHWKCPVFGAAVFFNRSIPEDWPSGVFWNQGNKSTQKWSYTDNPLRPFEEFRLPGPEERAIVRVFDLNSI